MPIQTPQAPGTSQPQIDPTALALARAIRHVESGDNPNAKGASGEWGIGQWMPGNYESAAKQFGLDPSDKSVANQEHIIYEQVKQQLDAGHSQSEVASWWNSGKYDPTGNVGVNKEGVKYDTPAYVKRVEEAYGSQSMQQPTTMQSSGDIPTSQLVIPPGISTNTPTTQQPETFTGDLSKGNFGGALVQAGKGIANTVLGPAESLGAHLGQLAAGGTANIAGALGNTGLQQQIQSKLQQPLTTITGGTVQPLKGGFGGAEQIGGDALQTALLAAAPGIGSTGGLAARLGANTALGAGFGGASAMSEGGSWQDVLKGAGIGGVIGGTVGGVGEILSKAAQYLPQRLARTFIPGLNPETAQYAVNRGLAAPKTMLEDSTKNLSSVGTSLSNAIVAARGPIEEAQTVPGQQIFESIAQDDMLKDAGLTADDVAAELKKIVPLKKNLVNKVFMGDANIFDLWNLNKAIGSATYKTVFDDPAVKAGKDIGNVAYHTFGNIIKGSAPDSVPLFDEYTKELQLNGALQKAVRRGEKARPFTLRDIVALLAGLPLGIPGMAMTYGLEKAAVNPAVNLNVGNYVNKLGNPAVQSAGQIVKGPLMEQLLKGANFLANQRSQ